MSPGLYDGFEGYRNPEPMERETAVKGWLVALDTNVLLSLYSFQGSTLDAFINVFDAIGDRLFVPHQVMDEFWRNRRTVLKQNQGRHREREEIEESFASISSTLQAWHRRVVDRAAPPPSHILRSIEAARSEVARLIDKKTDEGAVTTADTPTYDDRVLERISALLHGRVGEAPSSDELARLRKEGRERVEKRIPPGYMDGGKSPERAVGDFLVWAQVMQAAKEHNLGGVLLITNDQKEDWWAGGGGTRLARPELVAELRLQTSQPLIMMRAHELVAMGALVGVTVSESTVSDAEQTIAETQSPRSSSPLAEAYHEFWERFEEIARARGWTKGRAPSANWWSMPAGGGGNTYAVSYSKFGCRSELYLGNPDPEANLRVLQSLRERADEIQEAFGSSATIHFEELPGAVACRLDIRLEDGRTIGDRHLWDDTLEWLISTQENLRHAIETTGGIPKASTLNS